MIKTIYTKKQMNELLRNPCVEKCSDRYITFKDDIKYEAVVLWKSWLSCREVFEKYKFPDYILNSVIPRKCIARWNKIINEKWEDYFWTKRKWRIKVEDDFNIKNMNKYEVEEYYKIKLKYYKESYDKIKKNLTKSHKFSIILKIYKKNKLYLSLLCDLAWISISWFYAYKKRVEIKQTKETRDKDDYEAIKKMYLKHKRKFWYRMITMKLYKAWTKMNHKKVYIKWSIIHSDQWSHYINPNYIALFKNSWIIQSMSRKWNCLDNAPRESFFWHMKDEIELDKIKSFSALKSHIDNYIFFYNNNRPQWTRKKMTSVAYRNYLIINKN